MSTPFSALPPDDLSVVITPDGTANISWMAIMLPPEEFQPLRYLVEVSNSTSAVLFTDTVDHPTNTVEAPNLPACVYLTVSVTAEYESFSGTPGSVDYVIAETAAGWCSLG